MPAWCKTAIDDWVAARRATPQPEWYRVLWSINRGDKVWNESMSPQSIFMRVKRLAEQAGLGSISPHDLRRTFAKLAHKGRAQLEQIQLSLGHASIQTTERYLGIEQDFQDAPCDHMGIKL